jgi:hypothetical protein
MAQAFVLDESGPERVTVAWEKGWKNLKVKLDGKEVLSVATQKELKKGCEVQTDVGTLRVQLKSGFLQQKTHVSLNGRPLRTDPAKRFKTAYQTIYLVAGLSAAFGLLTVVWNNETLNALGFGWNAIISGLVFAALGFWTQRRLSLVALSLAVGLLALDGILLFVPLGAQTVAAQAGTTPNIWPIVVRLALLYQMSTGFRAIRELRRRHQASPAASAAVSK